MWFVDLVDSILLWVSWAVSETWWLALALKNCWKKYMQKTQFHICFLVRHMLEHYKPTYLYKVHWSATSSSLLSKRRSIDLSALKIIYNKAINDGITDKDLIQLQSYDAFKQIRDGIDSYCEEKNKSSRTAKLWLQYIEYVDIINGKFICSDRAYKLC